MPRQRTPAARAAVEGADVSHPGRHKNRKVKPGAKLGGPSKHLDLYTARAFERFRAELPWLKESHRLIVELASHYRGMTLDPERGGMVSLAILQELRRCLGALGATPADESKVVTGGDEEEDPFAAFLAKPN